MANADWRGANVSCVELIECRMVGFSINEGKIADCSFIHCNGGLIRFRFSSFNAVRFEACNLKESDFQARISPVLNFAAAIFAMRKCPEPN